LHLGSFNENHRSYYLILDTGFQSSLFQSVAPAGSHLENDLRIFKHSVMKARKEAIAFFPGIEAGRSLMVRRWQHQAKGAIKS
jgi:hypothetical protein